MSTQPPRRVLQPDSAAVIPPIEDAEIDIGGIEIPEPFSDEDTPAAKKN